MINRSRGEVKRGRFGALFPTNQPGSRLKPNRHAGLLSSRVRIVCRDRMDFFARKFSISSVRSVVNVRNR